ncbi:hypothetical protein Tco_0506860, partial [Tanacetum coccineum]
DRDDEEEEESSGDKDDDGFLEIVNGSYHLQNHRDDEEEGPSGDEADDRYPSCSTRLSTISLLKTVNGSYDIDV